jgi:FKBP-type peptidyl-prolyl cis-trans isomerase
MTRLAGSAALAALLLLAGCSGKKEAAGPVEVSREGFDFKTIVEGTGTDIVELGDYCFFLYKGVLDNGVEFDSNMPETKPDGLPFMVQLGSTPLVMGWVEGVKGMKRGETREITVPPQMGYGDKDSGLIPPDSTLNFTVELVGLVKPGQNEIYDFEDIVVGTGPEAKLGDAVTVHAIGRYLNGKVYDDSYERGKPVTFLIGDDKLGRKAIPGVDDGVRGMQVGGKRILTLPPDLAFGVQGSDVIQGGQMVEYEIELMSIN